MKKDAPFRHSLFTNHVILWILGLILAILNIFFLDYIAGRIYPSEIDDMGRALVQQLRAKLIFLAISIVVTPTIMNIIEIFYTDLAQSSDKNENIPSYFKFTFHLDKIRSPIPHDLIVMLIIIEKAFIISIMFYLIQNCFTTLNNSMDFLMGGPGSIILVASLLLVIDCSLIFCILLFSYLWGYSWVQWASEKVFPKFSDTKFYSQTLLLASLIFRALNMLGLIFMINLMVTFPGKFNTMVKIIFGITILLFLWVGIYIVPYLRERVAFRTKITD